MEKHIFLWNLLCCLHRRQKFTWKPKFFTKWIQIPLDYPTILSKTELQDFGKGRGEFQGNQYCLFYYLNSIFQAKIWPHPWLKKMGYDIEAKIEDPLSSCGGPLASHSLRGLRGSSQPSLGHRWQAGLPHNSGVTSAPQSYAYSYNFPRVWP